MYDCTRRMIISEGIVAKGRVVGLYRHQFGIIGHSNIIEHCQIVMYLLDYITMKL